MKIKVDLLRLMLPFIHAQAPAGIRCAWRMPDGSWLSACHASLDEVAARYGPKRLEVCPHPADVSMAEAELPPLSGGKLRSAVLGAVELLALASPEKLTVGYGSRSDNGTVPLAWMASAHWAQWHSQLEHHGLRVDAVFPPPAFLPLTDDAARNGTVTVSLIDDWLVVRTGINAGMLHPVSVRGLDLSLLENRLRTVIPIVSQFQWHLLPAMEAPGEAGACSGTGWIWTFPLGRSTSAAPANDWLRPALTWGAAAAMVWVVGLNMHAARVAAEGKELKREMAAQVKAAYPEISVVLNPLQQARQMHDARNGDAGQIIASDDFAALLRASVTLLTQASAQTERMDYHGNELRMHWRDGAMLNAREVETLMTQAEARGLTIKSDEDVLRIRAAATSGDVDAGDPKEPAS